MYERVQTPKRQKAAVTDLILAPTPQGAHACCSQPTERSEACSERSIEVRDCKLQAAQTKDFSEHKQKTSHDASETLQTD